MSKIQRKEPVKNVGLRLPLEVHKALVEAARKDRRSLKDEVIVLLEQALGLNKK